MFADVIFNFLEVTQPQTLKFQKLSVLVRIYFLSGRNYPLFTKLAPITKCILAISQL